MAEEADMAIQREREQARQAAKLAREKAAQNMNMNEQSMIMSFEQQRGDSTPAILQMFQLKPVVKGQTQEEEGENTEGGGSSSST